MSCAKPQETTAKPEPVPKTTTDECPKDELKAIGTPCSQPNKTCGMSPSGSRFIMCNNGKWTEMSAPPPPPPK